jgi:hypothetical protein
MSVQQRQISAIKADEADAYKIQNVPAIDNTFGDVLKMEVSPQIGKNAQQRLGQKIKHFIDQGQRKADRQSNDKCNDLIASER